MSIKNSLNNASGSLNIDPGTSGDSAIQLNINTTNKFKIGVDDTDDSLRISQGAALGTNDVIVFTESGEITRPLQPAFLANVTTFYNNVTGDGTVYTGIFSTEIFDNSNDFDGTSTFTAPISGKYKFNAGFLISYLHSSHTSGYIEIVTSNRTYRSLRVSYTAFRIVSNGQANLGSLSVLCDMDASDTAIVRVCISNYTKTVNIGYPNRGMFNGYLVC